MRLLIQRVEKAEISINHHVFSKISSGLLVFLGIEHEDNEDDIQWLTEKLIKLRIFNDDEGVMNLSIRDIHGEIMIVSQFTLHASTKKGARPSYIRAAKPEQAIPLYQKFIETIEKKTSKKPATGKFGADMKIKLINDGPVSIWIDSRNRE